MTAIIAFDGPPGSGKTSLIQALIDERPNVSLIPTHQVVGEQYGYDLGQFTAQYGLVAGLRLLMAIERERCEMVQAARQAATSLVVVDETIGGVLACRLATAWAGDAAVSPAATPTAAPYTRFPFFPLRMIVPSIILDIQRAPNLPGPSASPRFDDLWRVIHRGLVGARGVPVLDVSNHGEGLDRAGAQVMAIMNNIGGRA